MTEEVTREVIVRLRELAVGAEPEISTAGICHDLRLIFMDRNTAEEIVFSNADLQEIIRLAPDWEKYSGHPIYPIPSAGENLYMSPAGIYYCTEGKWSGAYGELRRELCGYLASRLETNLRKEDIS